MGKRRVLVAGRNSAAIPSAEIHECELSSVLSASMATPDIEVSDAANDFAWSLKPNGDAKMNEVLDSDQVQDESEKVIGTPVDDVKDLMRQARELVPVGQAGISPTNLNQIVDFARDMVKGKYAIPEHLKGNVGDCMHVIDLAIRYGLSPWAIGQLTYVEKGKLNYQSILYHAFAQASGLMNGDLQVEYSGEGENLVCIVTGYLRGDPVPRMLRSEPLKDLHPGHVEKTIEVNGEKIKKKFVKGSPLWDRKPKLQLFYDTSRDWVRMYAPRAALGIMTPYEREEYGPEFVDVTPTGVGLSQRLKGAPKPEIERADPEAELDRIKNGGPTPGKTAEIQTKTDLAIVKSKKPVTPSSKPAKRIETHAKAKPAIQQPDTVKEAATPTKATAVAYPSTVPEYIAYARRWIKAATDMTGMGLQWREERTLRNKLGMTADDRKPLEDLLAKRYGEK